MKIALIEPFYTGSHKQWALAVKKYSSHQIDIFHLSGRHWKWRMHSGAVSLAAQLMQNDEQYDLILATDMLDVTTFLTLSRSKTKNIPCALYFHENQLTYPLSPTDPDIAQARDNHYAFINYTSALAADWVFFNSNYHLSSFVGELPSFFDQFPDHQEKQNIEKIKSKSSVLPLLMDLPAFDQFFTDTMVLINKKMGSGKVTFLWNHRWEYDKNPDEFFKLMYQLKEMGYLFNLIVLGKSYGQMPKCFKVAKERLSKEIIHWGYAISLEEYAQLLQLSDIAPVTSIQDFFGASIVEAMYFNVMPLLPNRLAYPEHIPSKKHQLLLYEDYSDLLAKTELAMQNVSDWQGTNYRTMVEKYAPSNLSEMYDRAFRTF